MEYVRLGTDGGGGIPSLIEGYRDVRDLAHLAAAMQEVGLSHDDVKSYMSGNLYRVLMRVKQSENRQPAEIPFVRPHSFTGRSTAPISLFLTSKGNRFSGLTLRGGPAWSPVASATS